MIQQVEQKKECAYSICTQNIMKQKYGKSNIFVKLAFLPNVQIHNIFIDETPINITNIYLTKEIYCPRLYDNIYETLN